MTIFEKLLHAYVDQETWMHKITEKLEELEIGMSEDILADTNQVIISDGNKWAKGSPFKVVETINPANGWHEYRIGVQLVNENGTLKDPDSALIITSNPNLYYKIKGSKDNPSQPFEYDPNTPIQPRWDGTGRYYVDGDAPFIAVHKTAGMTLSDRAWIDMKQGAALTLTGNAYINMYTNSSMGIEGNSHIKMAESGHLVIEGSDLTMHDGGSIVVENGGNLVLHGDSNVNIERKANINMINSTVNVTGTKGTPIIDIHDNTLIHFNSNASVTLSNYADIMMDGHASIHMNGNSDTSTKQNNPELLMNGGSSIRFNSKEEGKFAPTLLCEETGFMYNGQGYTRINGDRNWGLCNVSGCPDIWRNMTFADEVLSKLKDSNDESDLKYLSLKYFSVNDYLNYKYFKGSDSVSAETNTFWNDDCYLFDDIITPYLASYTGSYSWYFKKCYMSIDTIDHFYDLPYGIRKYYTGDSFPVMTQAQYNDMLKEYPDKDYHYSEYFRPVYVSTTYKSNSSFDTIFNDSEFKDTFKNYMYHKIIMEESSYGIYKNIRDAQKEKYGEPVYEKFDFGFSTKSYSEVKVPWYELILEKNDDGTYSKTLTSSASSFYEDINDSPTIMIKSGTHILADGYGDRGVVIQNNFGENLRIWLQGDSFIQHTGKSHEEMHDNSTFLMRGESEAHWKDGGEGYISPMIDPKGATLAVYDKANINIHGKWKTVIEGVTVNKYVATRNWKTNVKTTTYKPLSNLSSELRTSVIEYLNEKYPSPIYEIDINSITFVTSSSSYYIQYIEFTYNEYPPEGWSPYVEKAEDSPLVEITENAVIRLHDNFVLSGNDEGVTISNGESSIDFSFEELGKLKEFINTL